MPGSLQAPHIRLLDHTVVVAYVKLVQSPTSHGQHSTTAFEEIRGFSRLRSELLRVMDLAEGVETQAGEVS